MFNTYYQVSSLARLAAELSGVSLDEVERRVELLVAPLQSGDRPPRFHSTLNNDGSPLQLCIGSSERKGTLRLIGDPGCFVDSARERLQLGRECFARLLVAADAGGVRSVCDRLLSGLLPDDYQS